MSTMGFRHAFSYCNWMFWSCLVLHIVGAAVIIKDPETKVSENGNFKLGFFSPPNSRFRYLGIWYNTISSIDYVWVANRNNPLNDSSGVLGLSKDGNLQVLNGRMDVLWSSNVSLAMPDSNTSRVAQLSNYGSLCLIQQANLSISPNITNDTVIWQSFDHATDSILPSMKIRITSSNMKQVLQSWKSPSDPSRGRFSLGVDSLSHPSILIWDGDRPYWRSGPWDGHVFLGIIYTDVNDQYNDTYLQQNELGGIDLVYSGSVSKLTFSHYAFSYDGSINMTRWDWDKRAWVTLFRFPDNTCDFYNTCGVFATCDYMKSSVCQCLNGFRPRNGKEWGEGNWSSGCVRHTPLDCRPGGTQQDGFFVASRVKPPDNPEWFEGLTLTDCRIHCLNNCSCLAYAYHVGAGCMYWSGDLADIQQLVSDGVDLYVRLPQSELGNNKHKPKAVIAATVIPGIGFIVIILCLFWRCKYRQKGNGKKTVMLETPGRKEGRIHNHVEDLPLFKLEDLVVATNNFHQSHELGKGGFGQVYKGRLKDGQEIAVKRLSATSVQGLQEFTNEVVVISRLQHRNLVRLLGFCTEGNEKMLVYEYMPNKSLDAFLFDPVKREFLDWGKRFNIVEGICRGLMYLHRDSRLRIIHRDLKVSNILLDEDLNPKISDFGMAKIFMHNQDQDETRRVVGTYGYMSPEYAMEGHYSEKSDVYSFGVLVLEIVTGCKNNIFWIDEQSLTLLGYVWKLWTENNVGAIIDKVICEPSIMKEVERCIQVGLLCVQEYAKDRPNIATILSMLTSEIMELPRPRQPGFNTRQTTLDAATSSSECTLLSTQLSVR